MKTLSKNEIELISAGINLKLMLGIGAYSTIMLALTGYALFYGERYGRPSKEEEEFYATMQNRDIFNEPPTPSQAFLLNPFNDIAVF